MPQDNIHSTTCNAILSVYSQAEGCFEKAVELFQKMKERKLNLDEYTWGSMISICGLNKKLDCLKSIHQEIIESGQTITDFLFSGLIISYSKCGKIEESIEIFNNTSKNSLIYNSMLIAYSQEEGYSEEALSVFFQMKERKITLNEYTWSSMISVCGINGKIVSLKKIHQELIESGFPLTSILFSELISAKCGFYDVSLLCSHKCLRF
uniref:Pentacotripeptide-repeat region of PRORP domain-containing protein n=1 Tax=Arcella intermedia TaxID=1963864 RepID=A0A6B2LHR2_9EUKA